MIGSKAIYAADEGHSDPHTGWIGDTVCYQPGEPSLTPIPFMGSNMVLWPRINAPGKALTQDMKSSEGRSAKRRS